MATRRYAIGSYCSSSAWGGLEMNVLRFLRWMGERGWPTVVYADPTTTLFQHAREWNLRVRPVKSGGMLKQLLIGRQLAFLAQQDNVRALTLHQSSDILGGVLAKRFSDGFVRLIYHQHMHIGGDKTDLFHSWEYSHLDGFITPVEWLANMVKKKTVLPDERIHIIPRGVELERYTVSRPTKQAARKRLDVPMEATVAGVVGRLDPKKCQHTAIEALAKVHEAGHELHLLLVGARTRGEDTGYAARLHNMVDELGLTPYVHFRPHDKEPEYAYAALDIFILTSKSETYGMVTVEALSSGLPVIATADGGTLSLIEPEKNGLLYTPLDSDELSAVLLRLLNDPQLSKRLATQAETEAVERFSHISQCDRWEEVIEALVAGDTVLRHPGRPTT
jgi:D-inositol-3-phosphate glycosyltransferase